LKNRKPDRPFPLQEKARQEAPFTILPCGPFAVLRDDLIAGGTKRRGLDILLKDIRPAEIFYAGTIMGHGALALAHACADNGKQAHIYLCGDKAHPMMEKLDAAGAVLYLQPPMQTADLFALAQKDAGQCAGTAAALPPGFTMPEFEEALIKACGVLDLAPYPEIWTCAVTGTLTRALKRAFPDAIFKTVSTVKSSAGDYCAPEKYHRPATDPPPFPSCPHTDAKVWQFARRYAADGALLWNIAG